MKPCFKLSAIFMIMFMLISLAWSGSTPVREVNGKLSWHESSGVGIDSLNPKRMVYDTYVQDQTTENISIFLAQILSSDNTLNSNTSINDETVIISFPTVVPVAGNFLCFKEQVDFAQMEIKTVTSLGGDDYECDLALPLDYPFTTSAHVCLQNCNMNVDGSTVNKQFLVGPANLNDTVAWDITRMIIVIYHTTAGDDGLFGNLPTLTNGNFFRVTDGNNKNLFNAKENADFRTEGYDLTYSARSGGLGSYGTSARITFNGQDKRGVVLRLHANTSDRIEGIVRDNLSSLSFYRVKIQGHVVD